MAGQNSVVQSNTLLVKWKQDKKSFKTVQKEVMKGFGDLKTQSPFGSLKPRDVARTQQQYRRMLKQMRKDRDHILNSDSKAKGGSGGSGGSGKSWQEKRARHLDKSTYKYQGYRYRDNESIQAARNNLEAASSAKQYKAATRELSDALVAQRKAQDQLNEANRRKQKLAREGRKRNAWQGRRDSLTGQQAYKYQGLKYADNIKIKAARENISAAKSERQYTAAVKELRTALAAERHAQDRANAAKRKGTHLNERLTASMRQMAGELASVYAAYEGLKFVVDTGMEFEKIHKMFLSVSKSSKEAGEGFDFVRKQSQRLGLDLKQSGKEFSRYLAMVNDSFSKTQAKELFVSMSELATVRGLDQDQIGRANIAISQMLAKGKIQAEELRGQLSEVGISDAFNMMAKAAKEAGIITGDSIEELQKNLNGAMQAGSLLSYKVLPYFTKQLHIAARANDALNFALKELFSVRLGRAKLDLQLFANEIWRGGLLEGMNYLLDTFRSLNVVAMPFAKFIGTTLRNAMITVAAPFAIVLQLVKDIAAAFGIKLDGSWATQIAKLVGFAVGLFTLAISIKTVTKSLSFLFKILGGKAIDGSISKVGKLFGVLSKAVAMYQTLNLAANWGKSDVIEKTLGVAAAGGAVAAKYAPTPIGKTIGGVVSAAAMGGQYYYGDDKKKQAAIRQKLKGEALNAVGWRDPKDLLAASKDPFAGGWFGSSPSKPVLPSSPSSSGGGGGRPNADKPQTLDVKLSVTGTDGLIKVTQDIAANTTAEALNAQQGRLLRGRE